MLKPEPVIDAAFTVKSEVPEDVRVTVLVVAVFTVTLPKERLPLIPNLGAGCCCAGAAESHRRNAAGAGVAADGQLT